LGIDGVLFCHFLWHHSTFVQCVRIYFYALHFSCVTSILTRVRITLVFKQFVCGFDILRVQRGDSLVSYVIDVSGWLAVKNSRKYSKRAAPVTMPTSVPEGTWGAKKRGKQNIVSLLITYY